MCKITKKKWFLIMYVVIIKKILVILQPDRTFYYQAVS